MQNDVSDYVEPVEDNGKKGSENELGSLHGVLARYLKTQIASGLAAPAVLAVAAKFLKDNAITVDAELDKDLQQITESLQKRGRAVTSAEREQILNDLRGTSLQ